MSKNTSILLPIKNENIVLKHFPTSMQAVVFRMWEMVPAKNLAKVLETTEENIEKLAFDMGLAKQKNLENWLSKGYITIIKNAWHILPYEQILDLIDISAEELRFILREDDYLGQKLGNFKPYCEKVVYRPLTEEERVKTQKIKKIMQENVRIFDGEDVSVPFDFFTDKSYKKTEADVQKISGVKVDTSWKIDVDFKEADFFADIFIKHFAKAFGVNLQKGKGEKSIVLKEDTTLCGEEHKVEVTQNSICIKAGKSVGILRGLGFLLDKANEAGCPIFEIKEYKRKPKLENRIIFSYCGLYTTALDKDPEESYPEELLEKYALLGINGVWNQGIFYKLIKFPYGEDLSEGYEKRIENLNRTCTLLAKYGIKFWLYINEPRALPEEYFKGNEDLMGQKIDNHIAFCTSKKRVRDYLAKATTEICKNVPDLGGFITINAGENLTNCYSRMYLKEIDCPECKKRTGADIVSEINNIIADAAKKVNPEIEVIGWTWGYLSHIGGVDAIDTAIEKTNKNVSIMCAAEERLEFTMCGTQMRIKDYTISKRIPSDIALRGWDTAKKTGHTITAKMQINNSWECSTTPFVPVFETIERNVQDVVELGVGNIMLSWTLGGYPSDSLKIISAYFFNDSPDMYRVLYGEMAEKVKKASHLFSKAFKNFPNTEGLYEGPQNPGVSNLLYKEKVGLDSTMTCFAYDSVFRWANGFTSEKDYENQYNLVYSMWEEGLKEIEDMPECEFCDCAKMVHNIFRSSHNQIKYIRLRNEGGNASEIIDILKDEKELAKKAYRIMIKNYCMGYEAANHYYYNQSNMTEKILNCENLIDEFSKNI